MSGIEKAKSFLSVLKQSIAPGNKLFAFLICLLVSSLLWSFNVLSENFTHYSNHSIEYVNLPKGKMLPEDHIKEVSFELYGSGFQLIGFLWSNSQKSLKVDFKDDQMQTLIQQPGTQLPSAEIFSRQLSFKDNKINVRSISPSQFGLLVSKKFSKTIPIVIDPTINIAGGYYQSTRFIVQPSSITLYSSEKEIMELTEIKAKAHLPDELRGDYFGRLSLLLPDAVDISISPSNAWIYVPVKEEASKRFEVNLNPDPLYRKSLLCMPSKVTVELTGNIEAISKLHPYDVSAYVEVESKGNKSSLLAVKIKYPLNGIFSTKVNPTHVECYLQEND